MWCHIHSHLIISLCTIQNWNIVEWALNCFCGLYTCFALSALSSLLKKLHHFDLLPPLESVDNKILHILVSCLIVLICSSIWLLRECLLNHILKGYSRGLVLQFYVLEEVCVCSRRKIRETLSFQSFLLHFTGLLTYIARYIYIQRQWFFSSTVLRITYNPPNLTLGCAKEDK